MAERLGMLLVFAGVAFFASGSIGLLRLPTLHARLHALTKADNLGLGLLVAGLALLDGHWMIAIERLLIWVLVLAGSATTSHLIARQALCREEQ